MLMLQLELESPRSRIVNVAASASDGNACRLETITNWILSAFISVLSSEPLHPYSFSHLFCLFCFLLHITVLHPGLGEPPDSAMSIVFLIMKVSEISCLGNCPKLLLQIAGCCLVGSYSRVCLEAFNAENKLKLFSWSLRVCSHLGTNAFNPFTSSCSCTHTTGLSHLYLQNENLPVEIESFFPFTLCIDY